MMEQPKKILVTGATGRIGKVLVEDLLERGFAVRATSSKELPAKAASDASCEWRRFDFMVDNDFDGLVQGCDAIMHLAADMGDMERMPRINVEATKGLALAAERQRLKAFCYTSTISVYGSLGHTMAEDSPVLTPDRDNASEYWQYDYVRCYGRTKLQGELAIREIAKEVPYVIVRPAVVVSIEDVIGTRDWGLSKRVLAAHRHAHHIFVRDVTDCMIWLLARAIDGQPTPGAVETYNIAEDDFSEPTHAQFMRKAFAVSGDKRFHTIAAPWIFDWLRDFVRCRTLPLRNPLWRMRYPNDRLMAAGYRFRYGMAKAHAMALETLKKERESASS